VLDSRPVLFQVARIEKDGEEWIVATIRLQPQRSRSGQDISNIERAVS
jgi:hypothetical protein